MFGSGRNIHIIERHNENFALFSFKNDRIGDFAVALRSIKILVSLSSQQKAVVATVVRCRFVYWFVCDRVLSSFCLCVYVLALLHRSFYSASVNIISRWTILNLWNNWNTVKLLNISSISNEKQFKLTFDFSLKSKWIGQSRNMLVRRMGDRKSGNYSQWNMWLNGILQQCNFNINDHDCLISKFPFWKFNHNFLSVRKNEPSRFSNVLRNQVQWPVKWILPIESCIPLPSTQQIRPHRLIRYDFRFLPKISTSKAIRSFAPKKYRLCVCSQSTFYLFETENNRTESNAYTLPHTTFPIIASEQENVIFHTIHPHQNVDYNFTFSSLNLFASNVTVRRRQWHGKKWQCCSLKLMKLETLWFHCCCRPLRWLDLALFALVIRP